MVIQVNGVTVKYISGTTRISRPLSRPASASFSVFSNPADFTGAPPALLWAPGNDNPLLWAPGDENPILLDPGVPNHVAINPGHNTTLTIEGATQFTGVITQVVEYGVERHVQKVFQVTAIDLSDTLIRTPLSADLTIASGTTMQSAISQMLTALGITSPTNGSLTTDTLATFTFPAGTHGDSIINELCNSLGLTWRITPAGAILTSSPSDTAITTFVANGSTLTNTKLVRSLRELYNVVTVRYGVSGSVTVQDATSIADYGRRPLDTRDDNVTNQAGATIVANALLQRFRSPTTTMTAKSADPNWVTGGGAALSSGTVVTIDYPIGYGVTSENWAIINQELSHIPQGDGKALWDLSLRFSKHLYKEDSYSFWKKLEALEGA